MEAWGTWDKSRAWDAPRTWLDPRTPDHRAGVDTRQPQTSNDEFGLALAIYERFPRAVRQFVVVALEYLGIPKNAPPQQVGFGTIPELCFFGLLLEAGFRMSPRGFMTKTPRSFIFQSRLLGGRVPGGAVSDFVVFHNARTIAVRVVSVFHDEMNPFGTGGAKTEEDRRQVARLRSTTYIDEVVDVNRSVDGRPLENGPGPLIVNDLRRVMTA